jgi:hypothetical protein
MVGRLHTVYHAIMFLFTSLLKTVIICHSLSFLFFENGLDM